jgi:hypothetical protein
MIMKDAVFGMTGAVNAAKEKGINNMQISAPLIVELAQYISELEEIVKAVAHIGIDWGYGEFQLEKDHIDKARALYERCV